MDTDLHRISIQDLKQSASPDAWMDKNEPMAEGFHDAAKEGRMVRTFPAYPSHGIIGSSDPPWLDAFNSSKKGAMEEKRQDFRKQKFDFHETYEKKLDTKRPYPVESTPLPGLYNLWRQFNRGQRTDDVYLTDPNLPTRFKQPELLQGYGCEKDEHPFYGTVSSAYGKFPPTIHDVPREYHALKNSFTSHLASTGMPKNRSLNMK